MCLFRRIPIFSIDTKKKEMIGNFKRTGTVSCKGILESYDHDFLTFANGVIVPHGIYDVGSNTGYLTLGISHDTSEFVCDNFVNVWKEHLQWQYPNTKTICILCDGGDSNASSHYIVKQSLMKLASTIDVNATLSSLLFQVQPYRTLYVRTDF